jgi:hypothetical protein
VYGPLDGQKYDVTLRSRRQVATRLSADCRQQVLHDSEDGKRSSHRESSLEDCCKKIEDDRPRTLPRPKTRCHAENLRSSHWTRQLTLDTRDPDRGRYVVCCLLFVVCRSQQQMVESIKTRVPTQCPSLLSLIFDCVSTPVEVETATPQRNRRRMHPTRLDRY